MIKVGLLLLFLVLYTASAPNAEEQVREKMKTYIKKMYEIPPADKELLDEINTIRRTIASGAIENPLAGILNILLEGLKVFVELFNGVKKLFELFKPERVYEFVKAGFGKALVETEKVLGDIEGTLTDAASDISNTVGKGVGALTNFIGRKRKRESQKARRTFRNSSLFENQDSSYHLDNIFKTRRKRFINRATIFEGPIEGIKKAYNYAKDILFSKPKNVFGPAADMKLVTWNRRLAQLAMVKKKEYEAKDGELTTVTYENKKYRILPYGTLATYAIRSLLGENIARLFTHVRVAYLAVKLWLNGVSFPIDNPKIIRELTHEMLFSDRYEVGCHYSFPKTFCIIGPIGRDKGLLYEHGKEGSSCKHGSTKGLCNPPPKYFYNLRDKYKKMLRARIEKFEIVEGFEQGEIVKSDGNNFMDDLAGKSNFFMTVAMMTSLFFLLRNYM